MFLVKMGYKKNSLTTKSKEVCQGRTCQSTPSTNTPIGGSNCQFNTIHWGGAPHTEARRNFASAPWLSSIPATSKKPFAQAANSGVWPSLPGLSKNTSGASKGSWGVCWGFAQMPGKNARKNAKQKKLFAGFIVASQLLLDSGLLHTRCTMRCGS